MATTPALRQKNEIYNKRSKNGAVAVKATEKSKQVRKSNLSYAAFGILAFALFGGVLLQLIDLLF
ncbi:hypothetical protein EDC96DRAFT_56865 [Choanephora cucurbitarum]|nr:hypothetical protein EDC96DRAFT_56865 [Choanephora cucurbitarum]